MSLNKDEAELVGLILRLQEAIYAPSFLTNKAQTALDLKYYLDGIIRVTMTHIGHKEIKEYLKND